MRCSLIIAGTALLVTTALGPTSTLAQTRPKTTITQRTATKASPEQDAQAMYTARASSEKVAAMLRDTHRQSDEQVTGILKRVGYRADDVTAMLIARRLPPEEAMLYTRNAGYASAEVATAMSRQGITAAQILAAFMELNKRDGGKEPASNVAQFVDAVLTDAKASTNEIRALKKKVVGWMLEAGYNQIEVTRSLTETGTEVNLVAEGLHTAGVAAEAAAEAARDAGYSPEQIAAMLEEAYGLGGAAIAEILKNLDYGVVHVANALNVLGLSLHEAADVLVDAGYAPEEIAITLMGEYSVEAGPLAIALNSVGLGIELIGSGLHASGVAAEAAAEAVKAAGYPPEQIAIILIEAYGLNLIETAHHLEQLGYDHLPTAQVFHSMGYTMVQVAEALEAIGTPSKDTAAALREVYNATAAKAIEGLIQYYGLSEAVEGVADVYNASAEQIAEVLAEDYDADEIALVLQEVFQASAAEVAQALNKVEFDVLQITQALIELFNMSEGEVVWLLAELSIG